MVLLLAGCSNSPQENVIREAYLALKADDWDSFRSLTVTNADLLDRQSRFETTSAADSFVGGDLRPREIQALRDQFERAVNGCIDCLDFESCLFVRLEPPIEGVVTTLSGEEIPSLEYPVRCEMEGPEVSPPGLAPTFLLVPWEGEYRILALKFEPRG